MAKQKNNYFELLSSQVGITVSAAEMLKEILNDYSIEKLNSLRDKMHATERRGDEIHQDIINRLMAEFITPIDQEDILGLVQIIDDVTDSIDEVVLECYMYGVETLPRNVSDLVNMVCRCVNALSAAVSELKNFKKPTDLRRLLVEVNNIEGEADEIYIEAMRALYAESTNTKKLISCKEIYESLEECCDLCEHAADVIAHIIIKNT